MLKRWFIFLFLFSFSFAEKLTIVDEKNILAVKNIIASEELIANELEKYLLINLKLPTSFSDLLTNDYLGENFKLTSNIGEEISFKSILELKLNPSVYQDNKQFIVEMYQRDLYRKSTVVSLDETDYNNSFVKIVLKSDESNNILKILKDNIILKSSNCTFENVYCESGKYNIRYYKSEMQWIEFSKKLYTKGPMLLSDEEMMSNDLVQNIPNGTKIFIKDIAMKLKLDDNLFLDVSL